MKPHAAALSGVLLALGLSAAEAEAPPHVLTKAEAASRAGRVNKLRYDLSFRLDAEAPDVEGTEVLTFELSDPRKPLRLDFFQGKVSSFTLNGDRLDKPDYDGASLVLPAKGLKKGPNRLTLSFSHPYSKSGSGIYRSKDPDDGRVYVYSDFEPFDASTAFPCFDQPDLKAVFKLAVFAPADWTIISTTRESGFGEAEKSGFRRWEFPETPLMSTYLVSLHGGPYAVWTSTAGNIPLRLFARRSLAPYVEADEWLDISRKGLAFYGDYFGVPYPFKKYDQVLVPDYNHGAMENIAAVTFSESYVLRGKATVRQRQDRADTILHEMAHMWFGDLVTMKWWDDLWLNESFATYMSALASTEAAGFADTWNVFFLETKPWAYWEDQLVTTHPIETDASDTDVAFSNFDGITYGKGASALKQIAYAVGDTAFRKGVGLYLKRNAFGNATRSDFMGALSEAAGRPLDDWTRDWLKTAGLNSLKSEVDCDEGKIKAFRLVQEAPQDYPTLRTHRTAIALYQSTAGGLKPYKLLPRAAYNGWVTLVPALVGEACPALVFPNAGDQDYVKVALDARSLEAVKAGLSTVADPLERALLWNSLWAMVLDAKLPVTDYMDLALAHLDREQDFQIASSVLEGLLGRRANANCVVKFLAGEGPVWEAASTRASARFEDFLDRKLAAAPPGSDFQRLWFDAAVGAARSSGAAARLAGWLEGKGLPPGFDLDQDRRWALVGRLRRLGAPGAREALEAERKKDPSRRGQVAGIGAEVAAPDWAVKEPWLKRLAGGGGDTPQAELRAAMHGLFPFDQAALRRRWSGDFFAALKALAPAKDPIFLEEFSSQLAPAGCRAEDSQAITDFLDRNRSLPAVPLKELKIARQENDRCVRIRALASRSL